MAHPAFQRTDWMPMPNGLAISGSLFAIGDVHGNAHLLEPVLDWITGETAETGPSADLVFLGDLIDRGHENFRTLELASRQIPGVSTTILPGNHEIAWLKFMSGRNRALDFWVNIGGASVIQEVHDLDGSAGYQELRRMIRAALPEGMEHRLMSGPTFMRLGPLILVHAGLDPFVDDPEAYLRTGLFDGDPATHWAMITDGFSDWSGGWSRFGADAVIHGHQPLLMDSWSAAVRGAHEDFALHGRLNLDFGSGIIDRLGGAQIEGGRIRYFCVD